MAWGKLMFLESQLRWYLVVVLLFCATELQAQTPPTISTTKIDPTAETCTLSGMVVGKADGARAIVDEDDLVAGQGELVTAAGA